MAQVKALGSREKEKSERAGLSTGFVILVLIALALALFYVRFKVEELRIGYEISRNNRQTNELLKEKRRLQSEFMRAKSPDRLELTAIEMGFKYPTQEDIIYIEETTVADGKK
jgi:cell division protein FtsL